MEPAGSSARAACQVSGGTVPMALKKLTTCMPSAIQLITQCKGMSVQGRCAGGEDCLELQRWVKGDDTTNGTPALDVQVESGCRCGLRVQMEDSKMH